MKNRKLTEADVTSESVFMLQRRQILKMLGISATALTLTPAAHADLLDWFKGNDRPKAPSGAPLTFTKPAEWQNKLTLTPEDKVTGYNNFYEFGLDKADPAANAGSMKTDPWPLKIDGEVAKPLTLDHHDLTTRFPLEERIYRMRCVEAWSMVVPCTSCWRWLNPPAMQNTSPPRRATLRTRCPARRIGSSAAGLSILMWRGYASTKPCIRSPC